jgi:signal peptidase II
LLAVTALTLLVADLVTKVVAAALLTGRPHRILGGLIYLTEARNTGAAFSFAEGATVLFTAVAAAVITVIVRTAPRLRSAPWAVCLGLILGGAAGNLVDRLFRAPGPLRGAVVDWISLLDPHGGVWPIFNLADSGIVVGGVLAVLLATLGYEVDGGRHRRPSRAASGGPAGHGQDQAATGPAPTAQPTTAHPAGPEPPAGSPAADPLPGHPAAQPAGPGDEPPAGSQPAGQAVPVEWADRTGSPDGRAGHREEAGS